MTKKMKVIIGLIGTLILIGLPILYKHFEIPQETTQQIITHVMTAAGFFAMGKKAAGPKQDKEVQ